MVEDVWLNDGDEVITEIQWNNYLRLLQFETKVNNAISKFKVSCEEADLYSHSGWFREALKELEDSIHK